MHISRSYFETGLEGRFEYIVETQTLIHPEDKNHEQKTKTDKIRCSGILGN